MTQELVEAARTGGPPDIEALIGAVWPDAYRLARAILGDSQAAEDVAQDACVILYRTIHTLRAVDAFRVWFYRIVVREATEYKRRTSRAVAIHENIEVANDYAAAIDLMRALAVLPRKLREVIVLHYFEDLTSREIAAVLGIPDATVRFRLVVARRRLRPMLDDAQDSTRLSREEKLHAI